jgi:hypothetical protein
VAGQQAQRGFVSINHPTVNQTLPSPVTVSGTCSPDDTTVSVTISRGGTPTLSQTVTGTTGRWATSGFSLGSGQTYTARAHNGTSDSKSFTVSSSHPNP